jgi:trehalose 6-phosphate synthase/phosphatase
MNLVVVSNRLPFSLSRDESGALTVEPGSGGLVTALRPILRNRGGRWIGWTGATDEEVPDPAAHFAGSARAYGYEIVPVSLSAEERDLYYYGFSNEVLWPLFHDMPSHCNFKPEYWASYQSVSQKFAQVAARGVGQDDFIWVHDYQLLTMARELRALKVTSRLALFLHTPFPPLDLFLKLPWRFPLLEAMLDFDLVGFQTLRDRRNFLQCVRLLLQPASVAGHGAVVLLRAQAKELRVGAFPISIDPSEFERRASEGEVVAKRQKIRDDAGGRKIVLGIDRLDYTKGLPNKLEAFRTMLHRYPELRGQVTLIQVVVPSREDIPRYQQIKMDIERLIGEINGQFTREGWAPIHYIYRSLDGPRLPAYYLAADVALVTPLKDGMNLVAKEYCATRIDGGGALVLSEFAGAAAQLQTGAYLVNPFDVEGVASTLARALTADESERRRRMRRMRRAIKQADIYRWLDSFLRAAVSRRLSDFPLVSEYLPAAETQVVPDHVAG